MIIAGAIALIMIFLAVCFAVLGGFVGYSLADGFNNDSSPSNDNASASPSPMVNPPASSTPSPTPSSIGQSLWQQLSLPGIVSHLEALQAIADANGGTRSITSTGFNASIDYIYNQLSENTDYMLSIQPFTVNMTVTITPATFEKMQPDYTNYSAPYQFESMQFSGSGDVTEQAIVIENLGCDAADFADFESGKIALISRGNCSFHQKAENAVNAGAVGALIYNYQDQSDPVRGTLQDVISIPVFGITYSLGQEFLSAPNNTYHMAYEAELRTIFTSNLIAETTSGDPNNVVIIGSHLDSVDAGPGINDNGSGSSANLQIALQFTENVANPVNRVRFIWYGAEEEGLLGSYFYVRSLDAAEKSRVALNLNFDMLGSPNYMRGVLNGTDSELSGSGVIMQTFIEFFDLQGLAYKIIPFTGRSDYGPYLEAGIPAGGVETGAELIKTSEERDVFGGLANAAYDPCYHQSCDTIANVNQEVLQQTAQSAAYALEQFASADNIRELLGEN